MMVVFLGPDGSGKSSVIQGIIQCLSSEFNQIQTFHLSHRLWTKKPKTIVSSLEPYSHKPYPVWLSFIKLAYFWLTYLTGFIWDYPAINSKQTLLIFDRYFHDLLADPKRYRYGAPIQPACWIAKMLPSPPLFVLLNAPPEVLQARKQEVTFEEAQKQSQAYQALSTALPNSILLDATQPLDCVVSEVERIIKQKMCAI